MKKSPELELCDPIMVSWWVMQVLLDSWIASTLVEFGCDLYKPVILGIEISVNTDYLKQI
jgi:hypothetical protein